MSVKPGIEHGAPLLAYLSLLSVVSIRSLGTSRGYDTLAFTFDELCLFSGTDVWGHRHGNLHGVLSVQVQLGCILLALIVWGIMME
jgi:hypothetical protein